MKNLKYFVYILYSSSLDKFYVGVSKDPEKRLLFHNAGKAGPRAFTKRATDWGIKWLMSCENKEIAIKVERKIKNRKSRKYIEGLVERAIGL